ncbi:MAG: LysM peptidoglycan-binding domain-containing protein [Acidimicrobiia bacterium]|nr:LysM peptidoglycan-binding domain-containing protein [Acidimicrobiia bacterium]
MAATLNGPRAAGQRQPTSRSSATRHSPAKTISRSRRGSPMTRSAGLRLLWFVPSAFGLLLAAPLPAQETDVQERRHTVREGDTLWDLATRYLSSPYRWNDIFQSNPEIVEDPHWIYPGELLRIPGLTSTATVTATTLGESTVDGRYPENSLFRGRGGGNGGQSSLAIAEGPPLPVVSLSDFRRAPLLLPETESGPNGGTVRLIEENPLSLNLPPSARRYSEVVISLGGLSPAVGDTLKAVRWGGFEEGYGRLMSPMAMLRVERLWADSARATVSNVFGNYSAGDAVVAADEYRLDPSDRAEATEVELVGSVVGFEVPQVLLGPGDMVFLDLGVAEGVRIGDEFGVFAASEDQAITRDVADAVVVVRVVHTTDRTSTAMVTAVSDPGVAPGDPARLVRRIP